MNDRIQLNDRISVGGQPSAEEIKQIETDGFATVVNLRTEGEEDQPMSPEEERRVVESAGLKYVHLPVSSENMEPERVDRFREQLPSLPGPVFVHCYQGKRAGAFAMMDSAIQAGWSGEETLQKAAQMGFECDVPQLKDFVKGYIDQHTKK
jgi:uncharacterized protein (TIGR01244 family)